MVTWLDDQSFPSRFDNSNELDDFLSRSSRALATDPSTCGEFLDIALLPERITRRH
jgi:hypothetical protein